MINLNIKKSIALSVSSYVGLIIFTLQFIFGVLFIISTTTLVNKIYENFVVDAYNNIQEQELIQQQNLKKHINFNKKILGDILSKTLYYIEDAKSSLLPFMDIEEIYAISVFDEENEHYAAIWREDKTVQYGKHIPENYPLEHRLYTTKKKIFNQKFSDVLVGSVTIYYSDASLKSVFKKQRQVTNQNLLDDKAEIIAIRKRFMILQFVGLGAIIFVFLAIIFYLTNKLIKIPIGHLEKTAHELAYGNLDHQIDTSREDELGSLARSFAYMRNAIQEKIVCLNEEIENKKQAEKKVRIFKTISDKANYGALIVDFDYNITYINEFHARVHGYAPSDLLGKNFSIFFDSDQMDIILRQDEKLKKEQVLNMVENWHTRKDGTQFPMLSNFAIIYEGEDTPSFIAIESVDITSIKAAEEKINTLNRDLEQRVIERTSQLEEAQKDLVESAHYAGMAEISIGVIHNVGNILNSLNISAEVTLSTITNSKTLSFLKANQLLEQNKSNLTDYLLHDPKGQKIPEFFLKLGKPLSEEHDYLLKEVNSIIRCSNLIKDVIATQQRYAKKGLHQEQLCLKTIVEDTLVLQQSSLYNANIEILREYTDTPDIKVEKSKLIHILMNLLNNAKDSLNSSNTDNKRICLKIGQNSDGAVFLKVSDNGLGIDDTQQSQIFNHGFTTKVDGHGFGLHTCANYMTEMSGTIHVSSAGLGKGAQFTLIFSS